VQRLEYFLVKILFPVEQRLQSAKKQSGFRALNDAVIVVQVTDITLLIPRDATTSGATPRYSAG